MLQEKKTFLLGRVLPVTGSIRDKNMALPQNLWVDSSLETTCWPPIAFQVGLWLFQRPILSATEFLEHGKDPEMRTGPLGPGPGVRPLRPVPLGAGPRSLHSEDFVPLGLVRPAPRGTGRRGLKRAVVCDARKKQKRKETKTLPSGVLLGLQGA